jgi:pimeloyl-ACP methyl ester carboxylesterase
MGSNMFQSRWGRGIVRLAKLLALIYGGLLLTVFLGQRSFLYHPYRASAESFIKTAQSQGLESWQNASGQFIGWKHTAQGKGPHDRVLILHGNAGCAIDRVDYAEALASAEDCDVYLLEYPGFGARPGAPSQESLFHAAAEALALLGKEAPVYLVGESLGTGVAAYLAGTHPEAVAGVLLVAPYHNMTDVAQHHMPIFPVSWLLRDKFPSGTYLSNYHGPVGMLLAGQDVVIPNRFGRQLYESYAGPKKLWENPQAGHNDLPDEPAEWWRELFSFWKTMPRTARQTSP